MDPVAAIFDAFGSVTAVAVKTALPQQTVSEWKNRTPAEIPPWHRPTVANAASRNNIELPAEALAYLASRRRTPKAKRPTPTEGRAAA